MSYPKILAAVPTGEHFDESAVNEGVWLSATHLSSVEAALTEAETVTTAAENTLTLKEEELATATASLATAETDKSALQTSLAEKEATIATLQAEVVALGKQPSGTGSSLGKSKDEGSEAVPVPSYLSDENPINQWADKHLPKKKD